MARFVRVSLKELTIFFACVLSFQGCTNIAVPSYIKDNHPYQKKFYAQFNDCIKAVTEALETMNWEVEKRTDPSVFEGYRATGTQQQALLVTEMRQNHFLLGSSYGRLNIYLEGNSDNTTDLEVRYLKSTSLVFKKMYRYRNDRLIEAFFRKIEEKLNS